MARNGYFQLDIRDDGTYIIVYPPLEGGMRVDVMDLANYLDRNRITGYDITAMSAFIAGVVDKNDTMKITDMKSFPVRETLTVKVSNDRMSCLARFYAPSVGAETMSVEEIISELKLSKINYGILKDILAKFVQARVYCTDIPVAKGQPPVQGKNAEITYHFDTNPTSKPKMLEDGSVDFHELNIFTKVTKGDLLATLTPAVQGKNGTDVFGNPIAPAKVQHLTLKHGRSITLSEDRLSMYSDVSGDVKLEGDTVFVSDTYTVPADVDASTGDINYDGNVVVTGNVRTGFSVRAKGSVQVNGVVEGAYVYAGDSIVLKRGMQGMMKGHLEAEKDIVANFVESGTLIARNNVTVGYLLHSTVDAGHDVIVSGSKAFIIGGSVSARNMIEVKTVGNQMETNTVLRVGVSADTFERRQALADENKAIAEQMVQCNKVLDMFKQQMARGVKFQPEQAQKIQHVGSMMKQLSTKYEKNKQEFESINALIESSRLSCVKVGGIANIGTEIYINDTMMQVKENMRRCKYHLDNGRIATTGY